jgi:hypothetical protein
VRYPRPLGSGQYKFLDKKLPYALTGAIAAVSFQKDRVPCVGEQNRPNSRPANGPGWSSRVLLSRVRPRFEHEHPGEHSCHDENDEADPTAKNYVVYGEFPAPDEPGKVDESNHRKQESGNRCERLHGLVPLLVRPEPSIAHLLADASAVHAAGIRIAIIRGVVNAGESARTLQTRDASAEQLGIPCWSIRACESEHNKQDGTRTFKQPENRSHTVPPRCNGDGRLIRVPAAPSAARRSWALPSSIVSIIESHGCPENPDSVRRNPASWWNTS